MMKEVLTQGTKYVAEARLMKPNLTKDRFSQKFLRDYQVANMALKGAHEAMLNTQGLFQANKCNAKFALKAIATLARTISKMKDIFASASLTKPMGARNS